MIAANGRINGSANGHRKKQSEELLAKIFRMQQEHEASVNDRMQPKSSYYAGESGRQNPVARGIDPFGTDADTHYSTEREYFLMVERGRAAVRNHPLIEQGINRLGANLRLGDFTLDVDSGDEQVDADQKADWLMFAGETQAGRNLCDYTGERSFASLACQSFFSQVVDGDICHLPLFEGCLQTFESHHLRNPWGYRNTGQSMDGIIHGVQVRNGKIDGYWLTPNYVPAGFSSTRNTKSKFFRAFGDEGNRTFFHLGFMHRFGQRRGISRLSPPRDAMNTFEDVSHAHSMSMLKKALIAMWLEEQADEQSGMAGLTAKSGIPQAGAREEVPTTVTDDGGITSFVVEMAGQPAQVWDIPKGKTLKGVDANIPTPQWFEHAALMLTMLSVNLDIPLMFLLLDGSKVNFNGGRMITDQIRLRFDQLQKMQKQGLWNPTYEMRTRQRTTPGHPLFDRALYEAVQSGQANPFNYEFRPRGWPYVKPLEDAAADDLAERRNLKSMREIQAKYGVDLDDHRKIVIPDRRRWFEDALTEAQSTVEKFPDAGLNVKEVAMLYAFSTDNSGVQLVMSSSDTQPAGSNVDG